MERNQHGPPNSSYNLYNLIFFNNIINKQKNKNILKLINKSTVRPVTKIKIIKNKGKFFDKKTTIRLPRIPKDEIILIKRLSV